MAVIEAIRSCIASILLHCYIKLMFVKVLASTKGPKDCKTLKIQKLLARNPDKRF